MRVLCIRSENFVFQSTLKAIKGEIYDVTLISEGPVGKYYKINDGYFHADRFIDISIIRDQKIDEILECK